MRNSEAPRVALLAGSLGRGGAEKQFLYIARELVRAGLQVQVFTLTRGEYYEPSFEAAGAPVCWAGRRRLPLRAATLARTVRRFNPDIVQAVHFFTNLYACVAARVAGCIELGSIRNDTRFDMAECGRWGTPLLRAPRTLVANSYMAARLAAQQRVPPERIHVLTNVIDLAEFDAAARGGSLPPESAIPVAIVVARLVPAKRLDRFLRALARVQQLRVPLRGEIVGDGPERDRLERLASELGLTPAAIRFYGARDDVPRLLARAHMMVLTSQHEGFPNVLLEGMAARLPIVTTPAGDAGAIVKDGATGFVVPFDDDDRLAARLIELAESARARESFGAAGRRLVEEQYPAAGLAPRLLQIYQDAGRRQRRPAATRALETIEG